jgi:hypothetical protein
MGWTHFLTKRLPKVATEMALNVLAYNMKRAMMIMGVGGLLRQCGREARVCASKSAPGGKPLSASGLS